MLSRRAIDGCDPSRGSLKALVQCLFGQFSFAGSATSQSIRQGQELVESGVFWRGKGGCLVQWSEGPAACCAIPTRPHRNGLSSRRDQVLKRSRTIRGGNPTREFATLGRKSILYTVHKELFHRLEIRPVHQFWSMEQVASSRAFHTGVYLGGTHLQFAGQLGIRGASWSSGHQLEHDEHVLRFQYQIPILHSRFANSECERAEDQKPTHSDSGSIDTTAGSSRLACTVGRHRH